MPASSLHGLYGSDLQIQNVWEDKETAHYGLQIYQCMSLPHQGEHKFVQKQKSRCFFLRHQLSLLILLRTYIEISNSMDTTLKSHD